MNETQKLVELCHELAFINISAEVVDRVKYLLLDYIGVAARGALSESSIPVHKMIQQQGDFPNGTPVIGTGLKTAPSFAALGNGIAAHSLELDDVVNAASLHPGVSIMSAALSTGIQAGVNGKDFIAAVVAGYEVTVKLGIALDPAAHYSRGFHPTGTCGTLGAAITAAKLLNLNQPAMANAIGIAGSQAAGSMEFLSDGAFTKRFHAGWSAHSGILAALLAKDDFTGPKTILEGKFGFLHAYSASSNSEKILADWGRPYEVLRTSIKPHACCRYKQGPIDCILEIVRESNLTPQDIDKVVLSVLNAGFALVVDPWQRKLNPESIVDAQFSMAFGAAVAILCGRAFLDEYNMDNINSPLIREMMQRIECVEDSEIEIDYPQRWPAKATIFTKDGRKLTTQVDYPKGDPENPLTWEELIEKFKSLTAPLYREEQMNKIVTCVRNLEHEPDLNRLLVLAAGKF
jgi:2-methylcitrate dehydratase PrpD